MTTSPSRRAILRGALALFMVAAGIGHFVEPATFVAMVPPSLPSPLFLVYLSGVAEIAGGLGLLAPSPRLRRAASFGLIALYVAVFPANVYMALYDVPFAGRPAPAWALWARLPLQALFIAWAFYVGKPDRDGSGAENAGKKIASRGPRA